jgi:hypothetical protein
MSTGTRSRSGTLLAVLSLSLAAVAACSDDSTGADRLARRGRWGSLQAILTTTDASALLEIDAGGCIGSYGEIPQALPAGTFHLQGTHTQLMGVYPGMVVHPAEFSGTAVDDVVTVTITVPATQQTLGPFTVAYGLASTARERCLYP